MDSIAGSWAAIEGQEIVNAARTRRYVLNGYGPPNLKVEADCDCDEEQVRALVGCDESAWSDPATDLAAWYDPAFPESADFAGLWPTSFEGLESTYTREVTDLATGGGVLGRLRARPRTLVWRGFLFGRTCCSVAYGLRWLTSTLRQARCGAECGGEKLDLLVCCPPVPDTADCGCGPILGDPAPPDGDDVFRALYNVGLVEGPLVKSQRRSSCKAGCGCSNIMEIEFSLVAGNPHLYRAPVLLVDCEAFPQPETCAEFVKLGPGEPCPEPDTCPETPPFSDPNCPTPTLPVVTSVIDDCVCDPMQPVSICTTIPAASFGLNFQGAPVFSVYSGSTALRSTTIRIYENPLEQDCDVVTADPCTFCAELAVRYIPAFSTLVIDGVNRRITIERPGGVIQTGEQFLVGNFEWPLFECMGYCVCAEIDAATAAPDACFSLSIYPQEM